MSSTVELLFNDSHAGTDLYLLPASFLITFDKFQVKRGIQNFPLVALKVSFLL